MKIGRIRSMMAGVAAVAALSAMPWGLVAQTAPELSLFRALGEHYELPADEVGILAEWSLPIPEIPVALALADRAGISPDALVASRRNGREWASLASRYGLDMEFFHIGLDPAPSPVESLYAQLEELPRERWDEVEPTDAQVVFLVNVRFLHEYVGVPPSEAATALMEHGGPAEALRAISP